MLVLGATLVVLVIYTYFVAQQTDLLVRSLDAQQDFARKSLRASQKSLEVSERAYVNVGLPTANLVSGVIEVPIENSGKTPAPRLYDSVVSELRFTGASSTTPIQRTDLKVGGSRTVVPPGKGYLGIVIVVPPPGKAEMRAIREHKESLVVAGKIIYDTGFGQKDEFPFCFDYAGKSEIWNACPIVAFDDLKKWK